MRSQHYDLTIIGAGVLGSFHAYHACKKGLKVLLLEKDSAPNEATVRNFGMVIPSGMSKGKWQQYGRRSLEIYKWLQTKLDLSVRQHGSIYIASDETECTLIHELKDINRKESYPSYLLKQEDCLAKYPGLIPAYCREALFFPEEITVEPDKMIHRLIAYMQEQLGLHYLPSTLVSFCDNINGKCIVEDHFSNAYTSDYVIICNGRDFKNIYPQLFKDAQIEVSKLQMMRTIPQEKYVLKGSIFTGLSIRRYESFEECKSYHSLNANQIPESFKKWGIHLLFKQAMDGSIIIGDSHEYATVDKQEELGFEIKQEINDLMLKEAKRIFSFPTWKMARTWNGFYAQCQQHDLFQASPATNISIITAIGGKGMTAAPALAEETITQLFK